MHHICGMRQRSKCIITLFLSSRILEMVEIYFFLFRLCKITNVGVLCRKNLKLFLSRNPARNKIGGAKNVSLLYLIPFLYKLLIRFVLLFCYRFMFAIFYRRAYLEKSKINFFIGLYQSKLRLDAFHFLRFLFHNCSLFEISYYSYHY